MDFFVMNWVYLSTIFLVFKSGQSGASTNTSWNTYALQAENETTSSVICREQIEFIKSNYNASRLWAQKIVDASGRPQSGMLNGGFTWLGDYDECYNVNIPPNTTFPTFKLHYCLVRVVLPSLKNPIWKVNPVAGGVGLCLPSSCNDKDAINLSTVNFPGTFDSRMVAYRAKCQTHDDTLDTKAKVTLFVISVFVTLVLVSTVYDIVLRTVRRSVKNKTRVIDKDKSFTMDVCNTSDHDTTHHNARMNSANEKTDEKTVEQGILRNILLSFSIYSNGLSILSTRQPEGTITSINGIRAISMIWIILGHTYRHGMTQIDNLFAVYPLYSGRRSFMFIMKADIAVDTFFSLTGLLLAFLVLKQMKKQNGSINWFLFYFHRFWRLTPPYMLILLLYVSLFAYTGNGPIWGYDEVERLPCLDSWWYNLLYIMNFQTVQDQCFSWAWYLANDMQFYVISPIFIISLYRSKIVGSAITILFLLGSLIATVVISYHYNLGISGASSENGLTFYENYYLKPYCRIGPFLIGLYTGYLLYKTNCTFKINKVLNVLIWIISISLLCIVLYGTYEEEKGNPMSKEAAALYNAVHRSVFGAAVCWIIFSCATGHGGFVNTILSWKGLIPVSRLTYCAYLIHPVVMYYYTSSIRRIKHMTDLENIYQFLGHMGLSYSLALILSLTFELPMVNLEKAVLRSRRTIRARTI